MDRTQLRREQYLCLHRRTDLPHRTRRQARAEPAGSVSTRLAPFPEEVSLVHRAGSFEPEELHGLVGAARFELATPSPPDWCANRAALRSAKGPGQNQALAGPQGC